MHIFKINPLFLFDFRYQVILKDGDAYTQFFSQATDATNPTAKRIYDETIAGNPAAFVADQTAGGEALLGDSNLIFFGESDGTKLNMAGYPCRIRAAPPRYAEVPVTFAFRKGSPYVPLFNSKILTMKQSGEVQKMMEKYLGGGAAKTSAAACDDGGFTKIGYENIFSAFVLLSGGVAAAWVILLAEGVRAVCCVGQARKA